ncbi:hypothetical protein [Parabacteroides goldsteinii]|jgi:hypothetical protein|uniref:Uncharacterized protein n=1 Tax=Parabacteroides goldsteinii TaxID=328812 RepID=A0A0J6CMP6_9BACT|nr:hypothetical protein [Parabacteroides goldsteinii]KMM34490.1 hypothetical protein ACM15_06235 [Parabacteroides goldsteinii]
MELSKEQKELSARLIKELLDNMDAENVAGQLDEIIFQFVSDTGNGSYGDWFTDRVWLLEQLRNMFLIITEGKMFRPMFKQKLNNI